MKKIFLATTTINKPTKALEIFAKNIGAELVVALDKKSKEFNLKNTIILSTKYQEKKWPKLSKLIGDPSLVSTSPASCFKTFIHSLWFSVPAIRP